MDRLSIVHPILAMFGLTALVWLRMYWLRVPAALRGEMKPAYMRVGSGPPPPERVVAAGRHFSNLFEVPILFYVLCLLLLVLERVDGIYVALAWSFAIARALHSAIHLTYNNPIHRFAAYVAGCLVFAAMAVRFGLGVI